MLAQVREHHAVDARVLTPALFQILASYPGGEGLACALVVDATAVSPVIAALREQRLQFGGESLVDDQEILRVGVPKIQLVQGEEALQSRDGLPVIVHAQIDQAIASTAVATVLAHDQHRRGLLTAAVAASSLPGRKSNQQPCTELAPRIARRPAPWPARCPPRPGYCPGRRSPLL